MANEKYAPLLEYLSENEEKKHRTGTCKDTKMALLDNIREKSLLDTLRSPMMMAYHDNQPFNDNMLRPCPMLENPEKLREMVAKAGAHSTDLQSPETVEHLCAKCDQYAKDWQPAADKLWNGGKEK